MTYTIEDLLPRYLPPECGSFVLVGVYACSFTIEVSKWPANPVDGFITMLKGVKKPLKVADMGCGEAALAKALKSTKHTVLV